MTKKLLLGVALLGLLAVPLADAHGAPKPREYQARLLADCVDDVAGGDEYNGPGYDLHSLDLWETWENGKDMVWFRVVLNGAGQSTVSVSFAQPDKSFSWTGSGTSWSTNGFTAGGYRENVWVENDENQGVDGDRFALEGSVPTDSIGGIGATLNGFVVRSDDSGWSDEIPGRNGLATTCTGNEGGDAVYERPDYKLVGPGRYATVDIAPKTLEADTANFVDVRIKSLLQLELQEATLRVLNHDGHATVRFHGAGGDADGYTDSPTVSLGKRGGAGSVQIIHLAVEGPAGSTGSLDVELTTDLGGRNVVAYSYSIPAPSSNEGPGPTDETPDESQGSPAPAAVGALALLAAAALRRR